MPRYPIELKNKAHKLRKIGYSIKEIARELGIANSTSSLWAKKIVLNSIALSRIASRSSNASRRGGLARKRKLQASYEAIELEVIGSLRNYRLDIVTKRLLCAFLYWGEGGKTSKSVKFMNSDPGMIKLFVTFFRESFDLREDKFSATLHLHQYHDTEERLIFWSKISKIPINKIGIYHKPNSGINIRPGYPGCICINYFDAKIFVALTTYYKYFLNPSGGFV